MTIDLIRLYFPRLKDRQYEQLTMLDELYRDWNGKINVISRKDIDNLYLHHVLHSLAVAKFTHFISGSRILDLGCGGGFPGIPLAILYPAVQWHLIDGTKKKITVVNAVAESLGLDNVKGQQMRAEELKGKYDFVVSRAVASVDKLVPWSRRLLSNEHRNALPNGLIALKGDVDRERKLLPKHEYVETAPINQYFSEDYFADKYVMYVQG